GLTYGLDVTRRWEVRPMDIGLGANREAMAQNIRERSTPDGRILWEDLAQGPRGSGWTAFLPELTRRPFLGGLSPDISIDHMHARLADGKLVNRTVGDWADDELSAFFDRYNVTRAICRTPDSVA